MSHDKDRETWLNFLDEIDEYLNTIESTLLELSSDRESTQEMDAVLRAIHTIKGGGSMIGCPLLSELAHRLEDFLKIIRVRRNSIEINAYLRTLLLQGLDCLRHVSSLHRQSEVADSFWLIHYANPIFDQLRAQLGELQASDDVTLLNEEAGADTVAIMFETAVEGLLERLEAVLANPSLPCLREELELMTEELSELGQMLQLDNFTRLCQSIYQHLSVAPDDQVEAIAVLL
ncbi:MAG: hypothetical protein HC769_34305 [Cyanobacteria bacterium CRU_2_1]|nr:hypothetical protein [Cyanobacteria bacterium CRU_2_1]